MLRDGAVDQAVSEKDAEGTEGRQPSLMMADMAGTALAPAPAARSDGNEPDAVAEQLPIFSTGHGQGWQPSTSAGHACLFSKSLDAVVLHGGIVPGLGRSADLCIGHVERGEASGGSIELPALRWAKLTPSMSIPCRCFVGQDPGR